MGNICLVWWHFLSSGMGIMQFESWQAMGFGVPVLRKRGRRKGALSAWPGSSFWKASPNRQEAKIGPCCLSITPFESIQSLLNTYCVQSACCTWGWGAFGNEQGWLLAPQDPTPSGGIGKFINHFKIQPRERSFKEMVLWDHVMCVVSRFSCVRLFVTL